MTFTASLTGTLILGLLTSLAAPAGATDLTPTALLASASRYDGQSVTLEGTVQGFGTHHTRRGTVALFRLCDAQCVNIVDPSGTSRSDGSPATITGTFHLSLHARTKTFTNVIVTGA